MKLISRLEIDNFRSIAHQVLEVDQGYLPIVGPNNSGKSNILRALNLFFSDEVEPGRELDLARDFHNPGRKQKRQIAITIHFELPDCFNYRKNIRSGLKETLGRNFLMKKVWTPDPATGGSSLSIKVDKRDGNGFQKLTSSERSRAEQFLNLILFRYQPNHIHPSEVLSEAQSDFQGALLTRLRKTGQVDLSEEERLFNEIESLASELIDPIAANLQEAAPKLEEIEFSTPEALTDLVFSFVPKLRVRGGHKLDALMHGSGLQSYLMYLVLAFVDTRFGDQFGWQQATVWAIEEPEAFLHQSLQHKVASFLRQQGDRDRIQLFSTTHSDVFGRYADHGLLCHLENGKTKWRLYPSRLLAGEAAVRGVVPYVHPLLVSSQKPLLLVEGKTDRDYLHLAYEILEKENPWDIRNIPSLDPDSKLSGIDGLASYLEQNRMALRTRPLESPVFVLVDWNERKKKVNKIQDALSAHPTSKAIQWDADDTNEELGQQFAGIERYLGTALIREAGRRDLMDLQKPADAEFPLAPRTRGEIKKSALVDLAEERTNPNDFNSFQPLLDTLETELEDSVQEGREQLQEQVEESEQQELDL